MSNLKKVTIEAYDADGELWESTTEPMDFEDVRERMIEIIKNDGVPVVRINEAKPRRVKCNQSERVEAKNVDREQERQPMFPPIFPDFKMPVSVTVKIGDTVSLSVTGGSEQIEDAIKRSVPDMLKAWEQIEKAKTTKFTGCPDFGMVIGKS